jgi:outer membrane protein OmpA-like peptidoglycan-associated protein
MKNHRILPSSFIVVAALAGCSSLPATDSPLALARTAYGNAQASPQVTTFAAGELRQAGDSLDRANHASSKGESSARVDHLAYVATQQVAIARETAAQKEAESTVANASAERDRVRLEARTKEANSAQRSAEYSQRQAEASQRQARASQRSAEASQLQSEASQRSAEDSQRQSGVERQAANDAQLNAQAARLQTQDAESRSRQLEAQLTELQAKKTDRGMVITLGDVLFDTNQAQLKSGGVRSIQKLADFFNEYPQRKVMIEGFTDSTGSNGRNQELSDQRVDSVRTALLGMGIGADRISSRGYGESYPVAGNDTAAGRQLNRRVEMVVSDESGNITPR